MALADAEIVLEGYVNPRDRRFETKESEDSGQQGRHHFHPEWAGYMRFRTKPAAVGILRLKMARSQRVISGANRVNTSSSRLVIAS